MSKDKPFNRFEDSPKRNFVRKNEQIKISQLLVIYNGKNLGNMSNRDALDLARSYNLDLVEVSPTARPPVCHIMDYGKYMFDKNKKTKENNCKQIQNKEKEIVFRYVIDSNDLLTKVNQIKLFLKKGFKVKCTCKFKNREKAHKQQGFDLLNKVVDLLKDDAFIEISPKFEGSTLMCKFDVKKDKK